MEVYAINEEIDGEDCPLDGGRFKILAIVWEFLLRSRVILGAVSRLSLFFKNLLMELREGRLSLLHRPS